jgi:hypothetical protein
VFTRRWQSTPGWPLCFALEAFDRAIRKELSNLRLSRATHTLSQKSEGSVQTDLQRICRTRPAATSVLQLPSARQRLEVTPLARPAHGGWLEVVKAQPDGDARHDRIYLGLDQERAPSSVIFERLGSLHRALPCGRTLDVGDNLEAALDRRVDFDPARSR